MERFRVVYRPRRSAPWETCYLVPFGRKAALKSAREVLEQEDELGSGGQIGIQSENGGPVTVIR
jgi:hypothetical protein